MTFIPLEKSHPVQAGAASYLVKERINPVAISTSYCLRDPGKFIQPIYQFHVAILQSIRLYLNVLKLPTLRVLMSEQRRRGRLSGTLLFCVLIN